MRRRCAERMMSKAIERAIDQENWPQARALMRSALRREPYSHWLLTRLGLTYYEQRQYKRALHYSEKALALDPRCPLVLWDYAGCLDMLDRPKDALPIYRKLIRRGVDRLAHGECGEGRAWARSLVADCHYRMAHCHRRLANNTQAVASYRRHLALRGPGCHSIYSITTVRNELQSLRKEPAQQSVARRRG